MIQTIRDTLKQLALAAPIGAAVFFGAGPLANALPPITDGLALHLDASQLTGLTDGQQVDTWTDMSGLNNDAIRQGGSSAGYPKYVANGINGQPVLRFNSGNGNTGDYFRFNRITTIRSVFWVVKENPGLGDGHFLLGDQNSYHFHRQSANGPLWDSGNANAAVRNGTTKLMGTAINGTSTSLPPGSFQLISLVTTGNVEANQVTQDRVYHGSWQGDIAEILIYTRDLTTEEEAQVGSYLAAKYDLVTEYPPLGLTVKLLSPTNNQEFTSGTSVLASASVIAGTGPYTVEFFVDNVLAGTATTTDPYTRNLGVLANGTHTVYATVTDSESTTATSATNSILVAAATTTTTALDTSGTPSTYGQSVTFTATVSPPPSGGTVQFYGDGNPLGGPVALSGGTAQYSTSLLTAATHSITADYSGFGVYLASSAPALSQSVSQALLTVSADNKVRAPGAPNPALTYKITGYQNGEDLGSSGVTGEPVLATSADTSSPVGTYDISCDGGSLAAANYSFTTVSGTLTIQVGAPPVSNGMVCWYDASSITVADGSQVTTWNDLSGNGHTATRVSGNPVISDSDIKYDTNTLPSKGVHFRGTDDYFDCAGGMFVKEQYVVVRSPNPTWVGSGSFLGRKSNDFLTVRQSSHNLYSGYTGFWDDQLPAAVSRNGAVVSSAAGSMPRGGFELAPITDYMIVKVVVNDAATAANRVAYPYYQIGRTETLTGVEMDIAEIIGYETSLSAEDEAAVGAYLAEKYGVVTTYPETTPQALIRSFAVSGLPATIDQARRTVVVSATIGTDVSALTPTFTLSEGANCTVNGSALESDVTPLNLTGPPVHCIVTSSDSVISTDYAVTVNYVTTVTTANTILNVTAGASGEDILNDGTLVAANHFGQTGIGAVTVNGVEFGTSWAHLTSGWNTSGQWTNADGQNLVPNLTDESDFGKLMREYIWTSATQTRVDIPGLVPGHTYRLQWITSSPRGGNISVENSPSVALAPNSVPPMALSFTWIATDTVANAVVTRQSGNYGGQDSEILFNGYALHDMGVTIAGAVISGVTPSQSVPVGTASVTLSGTVSDGGTVYPAAGEAVAVTVNGVTEYALIGSAGAFSIGIPTASLVGGAYPITYGYAGNWITLAAAPSDASTTLSVSGPAVISNVTPNPTRVVGSSIVTLSGTVSGGMAYPVAGELVQVTINGDTQTATITGTAGAFSLAFPIASIPLGAHTITYSYAGNGILLTAAPDHTSTKLTVVATAGTAYEAAVLASAPVSYWPLNETSGTTAWDIVGTNDITYAGDYTLNQEPLRNADGQPCVLFTSGNTGVPYNPSLNPNQFSVECWVKPVTTAVQYLVSLQDRTTGSRTGYAIWKNNGSAGFGMQWTSSGTTNPSINGATPALPGNVYHVVGTYDGTTFKLYVNGNLENSSISTYVPAGATQPGFSIGSRNGSTAAPSYIQDVALYNRALTAEEILTHYQGTATPPGYGDWAATYAGGQDADQDYNHDGVANGIAYFMGITGIATNPGVVGGKVSWPHSASATGITYRVLTSQNLGSWTDVTGDASEAGGYLTYTLPKITPRLFVRLEVVVP